MPAKPVVKHFASSKDPEPAPEVAFSVEFVRDGVSETHEFNARPRLGFADTVGMVRSQSDESEILPVLDRMLRRVLVNDDGTPARWKPEFDGGKFIAPDGNLHPSKDLAKYVAFEAGSSRRRWVELMDRDDEVEVEIEQIVGVFEYLTSEAADARPTKRSSPSSA
jgi:hypothetical protein